MNKFKVVLSVLILSLSFNVFAESKDIDISASIVDWSGSKVLISSTHSGTLKFKSGSVEVEDGKLIGGEFMVDMTTLENTDLDGKMHDKLLGHLKSTDFFSVEKHPLAKLKITKIRVNNNGKYSATALLTIKDITHPIDFDLSFSKNQGKAKLVVDRTKYDIKYGSNSFFDSLGDKAISNEFELEIDINL